MYLSHFTRCRHHLLVRSTMEYQEQQRAPYFSVENILREGFPPPWRLSRHRQEKSYSAEQASCRPLYGWCAFCNCVLTPVYLRPLLSGVARQQETEHAGELLLSSSCNSAPSQLGVQRKQHFADELGRVDSSTPAEHAMKVPGPDGVHTSNTNEPEVKTAVPAKKKRFRSHFSQAQLRYLDRVFSHQQYLGREERALLASMLGMTEIQIRNWFQNRRYQFRHRQALARFEGIIPEPSAKEQ